MSFNVNSTDIAAFFGISLSTAAICWNIFTWHKSRAQLLVSGMIGKPNGPQNIYALYLKIVNAGDLPVFPQQMFYVSRRRWYTDFWHYRTVQYRRRAPEAILLFENRLEVLNSGEIHRESFNDFDFIEENFAGVWVVDSAERVHKMNRKTVRALVRNSKTARIVMMSSPEPEFKDFKRY